MSESLLDVKTTADYLGVSRSTVYRYAESKELPHIKKRFGLRFRKDDLDAWLEKDKRKAIPTLCLPPAVDKIAIISGGVCGMAKSKSKSTTRYNFGYGAIYQRKTKNGKVRWYLDYRDGNGERVQKVATLATSKEEAALALREEVARAFDKGYGVKREKERIKFNEFSTMYLDNYAKSNKRSWKTDMYYTRGMIESFGDLYLSDVSLLVVERYKRERLSQGVRPSTVNRCLAIMKKMLNLAVDWGFLENNQIRKVKSFPEKDNLKERILTKEEEESLIAASSEQLRSIMIIALSTGMRLGEILNLQWSQIDLERKRIRVEKTKSGKIRFIDINSSLMDELLKLKKGSKSQGYLFVNPKTGKPLTTVKTAFKGACRRASIKGLRFHDLRHTVASRLIERGADIITVKELLGHSSVKVTERYTHVLQEQKKRAVELLAEESKERVILNENLLHGCDMGEKEKKEKSLTSLFSLN